MIRDFSVQYFREQKLPFYRWISQEGYLRHLVVRHSRFGKELMVNLVTTTQMTVDLSAWVEGLKRLPLKDKLASIWHTENDTIANIVQPDRMILLDGKETITEYLHGLQFEISPMAFFQTNSAAAEFLYSRVMDMMSDVHLALDLYCGTGTITQMIAKKANRVIGVELVDEAVQAARQSSEKNGIGNVKFYSGDVKDIVAELDEPVDMIIVDPPRAGLMTKVVDRLMEIAPSQIIYVSCNPKTLAIDLVRMEGYKIERMELIDMFPNTPHVEAIVLMSRKQHSKDQ